MNLLFQLCAVIVVAVLIQLFFPGRDFYHYGWFNVLIGALIIIAVMQMRDALPKLPARSRAGIALVTFGTALVGVAGIANGLLAPDTETVIGAPGASVRIEELGRSLQFPLVESEARDFPSPRITGSFLLRSVPRTVAEVQAYDPRGAHLTITQPSGSAFLSPVLLMQAHQTIAGMSLPFDSFAVPAAHRMVKAVLFSTQQAAQLHGVAGAPGPAVLFDAEDESERPLPNGIAFARDGQTVQVAGLKLQPTVLQYPAVEIVAIPNILVVGLGLLFIAAGAALASRRVKTPSYS